MLKHVLIPEPSKCHHASAAGLWLDAVHIRCSNDAVVDTVLMYLTCCLQVIALCQFQSGMAEVCTLLSAL